MLCLKSKGLLLTLFGAAKTPTTLTKPYLFRSKLWAWSMSIGRYSATCSLNWTEHFTTYILPMQSKWVLALFVNLCVQSKDHRFISPNNFTYTTLDIYHPFYFKFMRTLKSKFFNKMWPNFKKYLAKKTCFTKTFSKQSTFLCYIFHKFILRNNTVWCHIVCRFCQRFCC